MSKWIQKAIKKPGRVRKYLLRKYGNQAFNKDGSIKTKYLLKAIKELKTRPPSRRPKGLLNALYLALRLKRLQRGI